MITILSYNYVFQQQRTILTLTCIY